MRHHDPDSHYETTNTEGSNSENSLPSSKSLVETAKPLEDELPSAFKQNERQERDHDEQRDDERLHDS